MFFFFFLLSVQTILFFFVCACRSHIAYLAKYCTDLAEVIHEKFSVNIDKLQVNSAAIKFASNDGVKVSAAKQFIREKLADWHSISIRLHSRLLISAMKRFQQNELSVVLTLDTSTSSESELSPYILAGRPASHVQKAARLLQPIQRTVAISAATMEKLLKPGQATSISALEDQLDVYLHLGVGADGNQVTIISFLDSYVEVAAAHLAAINGNTSRSVLQCSLSRLPMAAQYLHHLLEDSHSAKSQSVMKAIEAQFQVRVEWSNDSKQFTLHGTLADMQNAEQAIIHSPDLLGIAGALVLLPTLDSGLITVLHRHFLCHVEGKMVVKCLALVADSTMVNSGELAVDVKPGTVVVGIFGPTAERVKQAQDWVSVSVALQNFVDF